MALQAHYLDAGAPWGGSRFALYHPPHAPVRGAVLHVHALAEEMHKSRRMVARQARRLADAGWAVLLLDRLGCGDSDGDEAAMDWQAWQADVALGARWLQDQVAGPLWLWGLRAGTLLAVQAAHAMDAVDGLLLWQPQPSGRLAAQQFLRLRLAADMLGGQAKGAMAALREDLQAGRVVGVAGYQVSARLIDGLDAATLTLPGREMRVVWLEVGAAEPGLAPASARVVEAWRQQGARVHAQTVAGPMFWQVTEIEDAPALWDATDRAMAALP